MARAAVNEHAPSGYQRVVALDAYLRGRLELELLDLVKLRASQINGCAFCIDMHSTDLARHGMPSRKIFGVRAWRETDFFSERERAVLALTEQITRIEHGVDDEVWNAAAAHFDEAGLSDLVLAIGTINIWNRIAISTHLSPPALAAE